jgi:PAS domain S-box-containing protein/putative nucleotidyltransferase with HDIG domain
MYDEICSIIKDLPNPAKDKTALSVPTLALLDEHKEKFKTSSAAKTIHHNYKSGLIYHTYRMVKAAVAMCEVYRELDKEILVCATALHDIGKITIPLEILNKPGRLTNEEWAVLRTHAEKGYQIASASEQLRPVADIILHHHERWDGKGYPSGLSREEIPVLSRFISIVDAYDAMVNDRAYRSALLPATAKAEIRDNAGTQFDPYLASEFLDMLEEDTTLSVGAKTGADEVRVFKKKDSIEHRTGNTSPVHYTKYKLDIDDRIIEVDDHFEEMVGFTREDALGKMTQYDLIPPEDLEQYLVEVGNQFVKGDIAYLHHRILRKDGTIIKVICNGERYFDSSVRAFRSTILVFKV